MPNILANVDWANHGWRGWNGQYFEVRQSLGIPSFSSSQHGQGIMFLSFSYSYLAGDAFFIRWRRGEGEEAFLLNVGFGV